MKILQLINTHRKALLVVFSLLIFLPVLLIAVSYVTVEPYEKYIIAQEDIPQDITVGLILGAGVTADGKPYDELKARLDVAGNALRDGALDKLILSGDNRYVEYNEPLVMKTYLSQNKDIPEDKLIPDYAGRSTYESCERAAKIFKTKKLIIFSAGSHLPRAIYLCRHFGVEAYGVSSGVEANNSTRRELLARVKAVYNTQIKGEPTVLGDPISVYLTQPN